MKKGAVGAICYVVAMIVAVLGAVPILRFWQQARSGKTDYHQEAYSDYDGLLAVSILLVGVLIATGLVWISRRFRK